MPSSIHERKSEKQEAINSPKSYDVNGENPCPTCRFVSEQFSGRQSRRGTIGDLGPNFSLATDHRANKNRVLLVLAAATHPTRVELKARKKRKTKEKSELWDEGAGVGAVCSRW